MERGIGVVVRRELPLQLEGNVVVLEVLNGSKELCQRFHFGFSVIQQPVVENAQIPHGFLFSMEAKQSLKGKEIEELRPNHRKKVKLLNPALNPRSPFLFSSFWYEIFDSFFFYQKQYKQIKLFLVNKNYTFFYSFQYII